MKNTVFFFLLSLLFSCGKQQAYPPIGVSMGNKDLKQSMVRAKQLNEKERNQIKEWMANQPEKYYPMKMNYWVDIEGLDIKTPKKNGDTVSYQYEIYDFNKEKLSTHPKVMKEVILGKFNDLKAVDDVVRYLDNHQEATLLVPSVLAFGTYGDNQNISNDMPLIIKIKMY